MVGRILVGAHIRQALKKQVERYTRWKVKLSCRSTLAFSDTVADDSEMELIYNLTRAISNFALLAAHRLSSLLKNSFHVNDAATMNQPFKKGISA